MCKQSKRELTTIQAEELHHTILNDLQIKALEAVKFKIISNRIPYAILKKDGEIGAVQFDEKHSSTLQKINERIDSRKQYISNAYCAGHPSPFVYDYDYDEADTRYKKAARAKEHVEAFMESPKFIAAIDPYKRLRWWQKLLNFLKITDYKTDESITIFGTEGEEFIPAHDPSNSKPKKK